MVPNLQFDSNNLTPIIAGIFVVILFRYILIKLKNSSKGQKPPEAAGGWPLIGHLSLLGGPELAHERLGALADKYGPVFTIRVGIHNAVVINSWEAAKECFTTNDVAVSSRPNLIGGKVLGYNFAMFGFGPYGSYWRQMKKILTLELLSNRRLELLKGVRASEVNGDIKELYKIWEERKDGNGQVLVEMKRWFGDLNMNLILRVVAGKRYFGSGAMVKEEEARRCQKAMREFLYLIGLYPLGDAVPFLGWLDVGGIVKDMKRVSKELDGILTEWLEEHKKERAAGNGNDNGGGKRDKDFMDVLLSIFEDSGSIPSGVNFDSDTIIKATCLSVVLGGSDTVVVSVIWALSLLLNHLPVLRKLQEELDTHIGRDQKVNESDISKLVYLQAVIKETMRLYGSGGLTVRETINDFTVNGFHIPKGTWLFLNMWKIQTDERVWPEPLKFIPERFLTTHKDIDARGQHFELIPFGGGRRACPGLSLGLQMVHFLLASLLHAFDISTPEDAPVDMSGTIGLTNMKAKPLEVLIKPRLPPSLYD